MKSPRKGTYWILFLHLLLTTVCDVLLPSFVSADTPPIIENGVQGIIASFGDFDSDKMTDVFLISPDLKSFSILQAFKTEPVLKINKNWSCSLPSSSEDKIVALMPADFHGMAMMDVLVVTKKKDQYSLFVVAGNRHSLECSSLSQPLPVHLLRQPLLVDENGDMITDILGLIMDETSKEQRRQVLNFAFNASFTAKDMFKDTEYRTKDMPDVHSNAFVDLNNDTAADLFIVSSKGYEYWTLKDNGFTGLPMLKVFPDSNKYPVVGQSVFLDINSDGIIDHVLPVCHDKYCESSGVLMMTDYEWVEVARGFIHEKQEYGFFLDDNSIGGLAFPLTLRFADFNGDGFPDFVSLMKAKGSSETKVVVLLNQANKSSEVGRSLSLWMPPAQPQGPKRRPVLAAFFDLYEDGKPDILVSSVDDTSAVFVDVLLNHVMDDATFIKVMVASGLCYEDCISYGTNLPGPHVCHEMIDTEGHRRYGCNGQLTQSAHFSLHMPYTVFGLGSTPNFVDMLTATIPGQNSSFIRTGVWTQIVPDAQVVLIPYPADIASQWRSKLFLTPSDMVLSTLITLASICILLILVIAFLHRKEILEDIAEHEEYKRHWPDSR